MIQVVYSFSRNKDNNLLQQTLYTEWEYLCQMHACLPAGLHTGKAEEAIHTYMWIYVYVYIDEVYKTQLQNEQPHLSSL